MSGIGDDDRTNAVGLFNTARSYWHSAEHLNGAALKITHPQAPVTFLFCHAIELYLKADLRGAGKTVAQLRSIGHRIPQLMKEAASVGLEIEAEHAETLAHIDAADVAIEARYIVTGLKSQPATAALSGAAEHLDQEVGARLAKKGEPIHTSEDFRRPPSARSQEIDDAVEDYIPLMTEKDREIIGYLLHRKERMFTADVDGGHARLLVSLGIIRSALKSGQPFYENDAPFEMPMSVWRILVKHKDRFPVPDDDAPHPWRVHWLER
jgi:hypothetical protein